MFDASHYDHCRRKYGAVGTLMSVYYKSKKGRKTEREVQGAEAAAVLHRPDAEEILLALSEHQLLLVIS
jgi:delta24-sterol reductase